MRINYSDEEEVPGQFALWDANCRRSIQGKAGQKALREFETALLAMTEKRLIKDVLVDETGAVCAIGAYARSKGLDLSKFDPEDESDEVGIAAGMPHLVAWKVVALNDITLDTVWELAEGPLNRHDAVYRGPNRDPDVRGIVRIRDMTPEERYERVLAWVRGQLR
jgi:hypothetical protein